MSEESVTPPDDGTDHDQQLEAVIADYIRACETGTSPDRCEIMERHPELADDLREFFANRDQMDRLALSASVPSYDQSTSIRSEAGQVGLCIGAYTLVQKLGEGGMGEVWVAKQSEPVKRKVALKLIKRGMNSKDVLARFEQERQALAMMDHPSIAKVFDGGVTSDGQPYFVMELVNGLSLTKYCDEARLTPRERMELFVPICQAVQHAHQKGIVHRDLKPSNILVTMYDGRPVPKVIDFGVSKATGGRLTDESMSTQVGAVVGTLEYMSPEQAGFSGQDIDTRADIYSLGVILYELLTGLRPIDGQRLRRAALAEMIRMIQEEEPSKPSTRLSSDAALPSLAALRQTEPKRLTALLRGELDWVVMKCLEKSRDRRYETANGLARDIQHYLADEPVEARPASASYRFRKFLRRHKGPVLAASLVLLALIGGIIGTGWGLVREANQRKIAETNEGKAKEAATQERIAKEKANEAAEQARIAKEDAIAATIEERKQRDRADRNATLAQRHLYVAHMNLVQNAWEDTRAGAVRSFLDHHLPKPEQADLRDFEWYYWHRLSHFDRITLHGHTAYIWSVAVSPDGKWIATGSNDRTVKLWDAATGLELLSLAGHKAHVVGVSISPDGRRIASASYESVKLWDIETGLETVTLKGTSAGARCITISPDGTHIVTGGYDGSVKVWETTTGQLAVTTLGHGEMVMSVAFSPDGTRFVSAGNQQTIKVWETATGKEILMLQPRAGIVASVAYSPDGTQITSGTWDGTVGVWDVATGRQMRVLKGHRGSVMSVAYSSDGTRIASAGHDQTVKLWETATGREICTHKGHSDAVTSIVFSPDGTWVASGSFDKTVKLWDASTRPETLTLNGHKDVVSNVVFSLDGKRIASASHDHTVKLWDTVTGKEMLTINAAAGGVAFSPDGMQLATAGSNKTVNLWDMATGQPTLTLHGRTTTARCIVFSPDGKWVVSGNLDGTVTLWDVATGSETPTLRGHTNSVDGVAFSPDGMRFASGSWDGTVKVWDVMTGKKTLTLKGHTSNVRSVAFSLDGTQIATGGFDGIVRLWNADSGDRTFVFPGHTGTVTSVTFSPGGTRIAAGNFDHTVKLWDIATGQETITLKGHTDIVSSVAFSPDGTRIASASWDKTVKLWDARPWTPELRTEQQALGLIRFLRAKPLAKPALLDAIVADATISELVRQRALEMAQEWSE